MPSRLTSFHKGEAAMHSLLHVPRMENPTSSGLPAAYAHRIQQSPLIAVGTLDAEGRPWTTVWGGERGFAGMAERDVLVLKSRGAEQADPVLEALLKDSEERQPGVYRLGEGGQGKMVSGLAIDLETRDRVKIAGRMVAAAENSIHVQRPEADDGPEEPEVQMAMIVTESLGNCPKYLNKKRIRPRYQWQSAPEVVLEDLPLSADALRVIEKADLFFMSSSNGETMDTNHRGGPQGFVRVERNDDGGVTLVYPEYSGNRLYQTLGNLKVNPRVGIVFPDFDTSDALYITGTTSILIGEEASSMLARSELAVQITVTATRFVKSGLPFTGSVIDYSPYNPPVRHLHAEHDAHLAASGPDAQKQSVATLVKREELSPTIKRFGFRISPPVKPGTWEAGQYVTLDFSDELDMGYSHMADDDPQRLNDDFIRTFTISSDASLSAGAGNNEITEFEITARKHGPATSLLWRHNLQVPLQIPILGFGGEEKFALSSALDQGRKAVFVAGGVGVTPLLAQVARLPSLKDDDAECLRFRDLLTVTWTVRAEDLSFVDDTLRRVSSLQPLTKLFITGIVTAEHKKLIDSWTSQGVVVHRRRMNGQDFEGDKGQGRKFFLCTGPRLLGSVNEWLEGEEVVSEDFGY